MLTKMATEKSPGEVSSNQAPEMVGPPTLTHEPMQTPTQALQAPNSIHVHTTAPPLVLTNEVTEAPPPQEDKSSIGMKELEERLKAVESTDNYGIINPENLCLVPGVVLPPKFKVPDFEKYNGTTCPKLHLAMYCQKMSAHTGNDKLLMHCFQESLTGGALRWYIQLDGCRIRTWKDLASAFIAQYKHITDLAVDRMTLLSLRKESDESFKTYARKWREKAMEVQPPLTERELTSMFINTLKGAYYEKLVGNISGNFADLVASGERIEEGIKGGKLSGDVSESSKKTTTPARKKEGDTQAIWQGGPPYQINPGGQPTFYPGFYGGPSPVVAYTAPSPQLPTYQQQGGTPLTLPTKGQEGTPPKQDQRNNRPRVEIDPVPIPYASIYTQLFNGHMVSPIPPLEEKKPPYPAWYKPESRCAYHNGGAGHDIENCFAFKRKVQELRNANMVNFHTDSPNVSSNPLPEHASK